VPPLLAPHLLAPPVIVPLALPPWRLIFRTARRHAMR
jgi:hypothetical protein